MISLGIFFVHLPRALLCCRHLLQTLALCVLATMLGACSQNALYQTVSAAAGFADSNVDNLGLNPKLRYLRVTARGRTALMVLGYLEAAPGGEIEVWYSSMGEVIRLQQGRLVGTAGLETDWTGVRSEAFPSWGELSTKGSFAYRRERDEMPGYRFGIVDTLSLRRITAPRDSLLVGLPPRDLLWFEETLVASTQLLPESPKASRPSARYAVRAKNPDQVVYADQCLSDSLCLAWQRWPVSAQ